MEPVKTTTINQNNISNQSSNSADAIEQPQPVGLVATTNETNNSNSFSSIVMSTNAVVHAQVAHTREGRFQRSSSEPRSSGYGRRAPMGRLSYVHALSYRAPPAVAVVSAATTTTTTTSALAPPSSTTTQPSATLDASPAPLAIASTTAVNSSPHASTGPGASSPSLSPTLLQQPSIPLMTLHSPPALQPPLTIWAFTPQPTLGLPQPPTSLTLSPPYQLRLLFCLSS